MKLRESPAENGRVGISEYTMAYRYGQNAPSCDPFRSEMWDTFRKSAHSIPT